MLENVFLEQNPWFALGQAPPSLAPVVERPLAQVLWRRLLRDEPARYQLILGPRRVGKTTVLYQTVRHLLARGIEPSRVWWLRLDHPVLMESDFGELLRAVVAGANATSDRPAYVMLDELVYARNWGHWLKTLYDDRWPVRVAATASAAAALGRGRSESGFGRWAEQHLMPCLFGEFLDLVGAPRELSPEPHLAATLRALPSKPLGLGHADLGDWREAFLLIGGFPELIALHRLEISQPETAKAQPVDLPSAQPVLREDSFQRAIYRDIPQSFGVNDPIKLERLLYTLADQITGLLSPTTLARNLGFSQPTLDRYLSYLERAFLVFTLPNYGGSEAKVQRRGRKLYFIDGAVRNAALQRGAAPLNDPRELGLLIENLAASSLHALALHSGLRAYHWRDGRHEVDLILDDPRQPVAFEIGSSTRHSRSGLAKLIERHGRFRGHAYLVAPQAAVQRADAAGAGIGALPLDTFLLAVSAQARLALLERLGYRSKLSPSSVAGGVAGSST